MPILIPIFIFGWPLVVVWLFRRLSPAAAASAAIVGAWLFLPVAEYPIQGLPDWTRMNATCYGILLAALLTDKQRLAQFRPAWFDLPMLAWSLSPIASSVSNDLGLYDGISQSLEQTFAWGVPYVIGRIYLNSPAALRTAAIAFVIGGLLYVPLCLFEVRFSPQLHRLVYGVANFDFGQTMRYGGYRPVVFMVHGLMVGMWMVSAALLGIWLWRTGVLRAVWLGRWRLGAAWLMPLLAATAVLCKSTGAIALGVLGAAALWLGTWCRTRVILAVLLVLPAAYVAGRSTGTLSGQTIMSALSASATSDRAQSAEFRILNENILLARAMERPAFGWGGWGRARVWEDDGEELKDISVTDGLWIIVLGDRGMFGLAALAAATAMPVVLLLRAVPARRWAEPAVAPAAGIAVLLAMYFIDAVPNAMANPVYMFIGGGLATVAPMLARQTAAAASHRTASPAALSLSA